MTTQKKAFNLFDQYEIAHIFTDSTKEYMNKKYTPIHTKFYIRCIIGTLLAINAYISHWGPIRWPHNYNLLIFSIIFYYVGCFVYDKLNVVSASQGCMVGQYKINDESRMITFTISKDRKEYLLQIYDFWSRKTCIKKSFLYYEYFTESGVFLQKQFHKNLKGFLVNSKL